jgi:hypothetical protein
MSSKLLLGAILAFISATTLAFGASYPSDLRHVTGLKFPNSPVEGRLPVEATVTTLAPGEMPSGYTELLPYVLYSPDQDEAGSCLYMTLTGVSEFYLARKNPRLSRAPEGPLDLSERHLMNVAGLEEGGNGTENWKTDSVYILNGLKGLMKNSDYRFTKGWYKVGADNEYEKASKDEKGAIYDTGYNWIDERPAKAPLVSLPHFNREVLFADPESDQWNTGVMPADIVERVKLALVEKKAPVQIIYNHFGYWHSNFIVGFDDEKSNDDCKFVRDFLVYMKNRPAELRKEAEAAKSQKEKAALLAKANRAEKAYRKTSSTYKKGGCEGKGVFYVRDSIYPDSKGPAYNYDPTNPEGGGFYSKKLVLLEYEWVRYMGNHAIQILAN